MRSISAPLAEKCKLDQGIVQLDVYSMYKANPACLLPRRFPLLSNYTCTQGAPVVSWKKGLLF